MRKSVWEAKGGGEVLNAPVVQSYEEPGMSCAHTPHGVEEDGNTILKGFERYAEPQG